jgi:hypothetical protein
MELLAPLVALIALAIALAMRPWRLLANGGLLSPLLAALVITPWLWALPWLHRMPIQLQLSGACMIGLALGWPLAVPVLCVVALLAGLLAPLTGQQQLDMAVWLGIVPVTLSLGLGLVLRRWVDGPPADNGGGARTGHGGTLAHRLGGCLHDRHADRDLRGLSPAVAGHLVRPDLRAAARTARTARALTVQPAV